MSDEPVSTRKNGENPLVTFIRSLTRLILVLLVGAAFGIALYMTYFFVLKDMVLQPAEMMQEQLQIAETSQAKVQDQVNERLSQYNDRITELESQHDLDAETLAVLQNDLEALQSALEDQAALITRIESLETSLEDMLAQGETLSTGIEQNEESIVEIQATQQAANKSNTADLLREVQLLHALELLDRSRLYLLQRNFGLAEQDVLFAREVLLLIYQDAPGDQQDAIANWIERLDAIAENLPSSPRLATVDLEIVWNMMIMGLDEAEFSTDFTPLNLSPSESGDQQGTPEITETVTATPTPE